jgi:hypothetical protein
MSQMNPVRILTLYYLRTTFILSFHVRLRIVNGIFPSDFLTKTVHEFFHHIPATCSAHLVLLHLISLKYLLKTQIMRLLIQYSLCSCPYILLSNLFSLVRHLQPVFFPSGEKPLSHSSDRKIKESE